MKQICLIANSKDSNHVDELMEEIINEKGTKALETIVSHAMDINVPYFKSNTLSNPIPQIKMIKHPLCNYNKKKRCRYSDGRHCSYDSPCEEYTNYVDKSRYETEGVTYMAGDLVMTDGIMDTRKGIPFIITSTQPRCKFSLKEGEVIRDVVYLDELENEGNYIPFCTWTKHVVPITLTPKILEDNGWKKEYAYSDEVSYTNNKYLHVAFRHDDSTIKVSVGYFTLPNGIKYVHELQHLLFGLKLNSEFKV